MSEEALVSCTPSPVTVDSLIRDFNELGLQPGSTVLVHTALSALGWVSGGPVAVIQALEAVLTPQGTLVMPTHSGDYSDPAEWCNPPVPQEWWQTIRDSMPAFQPDLTPTRKMGAVAEAFRKQSGVLRSSHPQVSFAAWGQRAEYATAQHALEFSLGEGSPLARIYELHGQVLLLGCGHDTNTSLHLAEYRAAFASKQTARMGAPIIAADQRKWVWYQDIKFNSDDFMELGEAFEQQTNLVRRGNAGKGHALLMPQRELVDFAVAWMETHRK